MKRLTTILSSLLTLIFIINVYAFEQQSVNEFLGKWKYETDNYSFIIEINSISNNSIDATYSIAADAGKQIDVPFEDENNIEFKEYNNSENSLKLIFISKFDLAVYKATLTKTANNKIQFTLGEAIKEGAHLFPWKAPRELIKFE